MGFCSPTREAKGCNPSHTLSARQPGVQALGSHFSQPPLCCCTRKGRPSPVARAALGDPLHSQEDGESILDTASKQRAVTLGGPRPATAPYVDVGHSTAVGWLGNVSAPAMSPGPGVAQIYGGSLVGASCALYHVSTALVTHSWVAIKPVPRHCHRCPGAESALESCPHLLHPRLQGTAPGDLLLWLTGEPTDNGACL